MVLLPFFQRGSTSAYRRYLLLFIHIHFLGKRDVRFCGLLLGQDTLGEDEMDIILENIQESKTKSVSIDWFDIQSENLIKISAMAKEGFNIALDAFHLTMIDLNDSSRLGAVTGIIGVNKPIVDIILTFCQIDCDNVHLLGKALETNTHCLSLNINFNLLRKTGYLILAESLLLNNTLRYLEAKLNKAEKPDLIEFANKLKDNKTIEYLDLGQEDDIDGVIEKNKIPEKDKKAPKQKPYKLDESDIKVKEDSSIKTDAVEVGTTPGNTRILPATADTQQQDLLEIVKDYVKANKTKRVTSETQTKVKQLKAILSTETSSIRASLKHCKIMMLGAKGTGKTFFAHCLVHQLYHAKDDNVTPAVRKLDPLSFSRVTELGWTKISSFHHVDMILAKRISTLPINIENRNKANEVCFQFPEQVIISEKDLQTESMLAKEDKLLLEKLEINEEPEEKVEADIFSDAELENIEGRFTESMNDLIGKALRENNYPSFSIWDVDSPPGYNEIFPFFYNSHGMIFVFFSIAEVKKNPETVIESILTYLTPIESALEENRDFTSKVFLIGTFLDKVLNDGIDEDLKRWQEKFEENAAEEGVTLNDEKQGGHINFVLNKLEEQTDFQVVKGVKKMLQMFNVHLYKQIKDLYKDFIVPNDGEDLYFFPLSNNLPNMCKKMRCDFDDLSGINKFRAKVRELIDKDEISVINVMKSLKDAKIIDQLIERKSKVRAGTQDHKSDYLSLNEFQELAFKAGITSRAETVILLRYLDVTGIVTWINDTQTLQNVVVLNPDYIINGLKRFYTALTKNDKSLEFNQAITNEAESQGLLTDVKNLTTTRVVSQDLLLEKLLYRDNFEYFKDFLENSFHLNKINVTVLNKLFEKQNLCVTSKTAHDDLYLVPVFDEATDSDVSGKANLFKQNFLKYRAKFESAKGHFPKGTFERTFTSVLDALNNEVMEERLQKSLNTLTYENQSATFKFGEDSFCISYIKDDAENKYFLQFEFSDNAASKYLDFVERVVRNGEFLTEGYVRDGNSWVKISEAKKAKTAPYYTTQEVSHLDVDNLAEAFEDL